MSEQFTRAAQSAANAGLARRVTDWQREHGRHGLPWQGKREPYRVWLSEIMLQQTQVTTVLAYYHRFLERFPNLAALAAASPDEVLAAWSGLGYYSRARNLHRCAQVVMAEHEGRFPESAEQLAALPGIGRSTAAAIAAFCFQERAAILDGNVKRVLTRVLGNSSDLSETAHERTLWRQACELLPHDNAEMPAYTQGLMDLGATICLARRPSCLVCPLQALCVARREGRPEAYPVKTRKLARGTRENWWLWLEHAGAVWLQQRPATGVWAGLWSLPIFEDEAALRSAAHALGVTPHSQASIRHALTHFDWLLHLHRALLSKPNEAQARLGPGRWIGRGELHTCGMPAPLKKMLAP